MPRRKKSQAKNRALLIFATSDGDANMFYATRFFVPDPFIFFQEGGRKFVVMSDLEIDRAKKQAATDYVLSLSEYQRRAQKNGKRVTTGAILEEIFRERRIRSLIVPSNFPTALSDELRSRKFRVIAKKDPFFETREFKSPEEVRMIQESIAVAERGLDAGIQALRRAKIGKDRYLYSHGRRLTSEDLKSIVNTAIMGQGMVPSHTIIASGNQCCDPHHEGSGPIRAHTSIIFDIFPRSQKTGYFGDLSRTVVRGRASERLKDAYESVRQGQEIAFRTIRDGTQGDTVHKKILQLFEKRGFPTANIQNRMQGFFHGTGHGLGLDIHEPPRISSAQATLRTGHVVTVEPGLYYLGMGGVRLEDVVVVTSKGNRNLTRYPKFLEI